MEAWKCIKGYCGYYQVSSMGRVRRLAGVHKSSNGSVFMTEERVKKEQIGKAGYPIVCLSVRSLQKTFYVHRLVADAFIENDDGKTQVNHIDGDKTNNSIENLEWCTPAENSKHAYDSGLSKPSMLGVTAEKCANSKYAVIAKKGSKVLRMVGNKQFVENGFSPAGVNRCVNGVTKQYKGYTMVKEFL